MKTSLVFSFILIQTIGLMFAQGLLDLNEKTKVKRYYLMSIDKSAEFDDESKELFPIISFGSDLNTGSDAVGFRPSIGAGSPMNYFDRLQFYPSIKYTVVDNQKFTEEKTGQSIFIKEISTYSINLDMSYGFFDSGNPRKKRNYDKTLVNEKKDDFYWLGLNLSFNYRGNSLFNLDSTNFESVKSDIGSLNLSFGIETIAVPNLLSFYTNITAMSIVNNRNNFHNYFSKETHKDFYYPEVGFMFRVLKGKEEFKNIVIDFSGIWLTDRMKAIAGTNDSFIPVIKLGYVQNIGLKKPQ